MDFATRYGPWALVAGASEGLGAAFARALAARGLNLVLVARRESKLAEVRDAIRLAQPNCDVRCLPLDLGQAEAPTILTEAVAELDLGLFVYNAAISPAGNFLQISPQQHAHVVAVNVRTPLQLAHAFGRRMHERGRGGIVLMSSLTAFQGSPFVAAYGASKAWNLSLAEALWYELRPAGIDVLGVCAGATRTPGYLARTGGGAPGELSPEAVVARALADLGRGPLSIPGRFNRMVSWVLTRLLPRRVVIRIMGKQTQKVAAARPRTEE